MDARHNQKAGYFFFTMGSLWVGGTSMRHQQDVHTTTSFLFLWSATTPESMPNSSVLGENSSQQGVNLGTTHVERVLKF